MEEKDLTQALFDKTDALIAKHRQSKPAVFPTPLDAVMPTPPLPVLSKKVSAEEADRLLTESASSASSLPAAQSSVGPAPLVSDPFISAAAVPTLSVSSVVDGAGPEDLLLPETMSLAESALPEPMSSPSVSPTSVMDREALWDEAAHASAAPVPAPSTTTSSAAPLSSAQMDALVEAIAPELADLVAELAKEISGTVIRQMTPKIREIVEKRSRHLIVETMTTLTSSSDDK